MPKLLVAGAILVALLPGDLATIIQVAVNDASIRLILSLSRGLAAALGSFAGMQAAAMYVVPTPWTQSESGLTSPEDRQ